MNMFDRATKLRWRRRFRRSRRQVEDIGVQAEEQLEQHIFKRLGRFALVRRFVVGWVALFALLISAVLLQLNWLGQHYQSAKPVTGGIFTEGIMGNFTNASPLYASGAVDSSVSKLVFAGLLKYDQNGVLQADLAARWSADDKGSVYKVTLKPDLKWQDGQPLTAEDVVFTYQIIQNPETKSPLNGSWQGVKIEAKDARTIVFTLPNALASFPYSLTNGIIPKHILKDVAPAQMRSVRFDTANPVGAGPFAWEGLEVTGDGPDQRHERIALKPNPYYHGGTPKLKRFVIQTFGDEKSMLKSYKDNELTAMSGLSSTSDLEKDISTQEYSISYMAEVGVFFRNSQEILADKKIRQALVAGVDTAGVLNELSYPAAPARGPLLPFQLGYNKDLTQLPYNVKLANQWLDEAGWVKGNDGYRTKAGKQLSFQLYAQSNNEYAAVTQRLQSMWKAIGVKVEVLLQSDEDLQRPVSDHRYDALLYGISLGRDPDVFAYWHSTQASSLAVNRLNFSEYKSTAADKALEAGRTRADPSLRAVKYKPFLEAWRTDAPAVMLYRPRYLYVSNTQIAGFNVTLLNNSSDRYANVENWMIRQAKIAN